MTDCQLDMKYAMAYDSRAILVSSSFLDQSVFMRVLGMHNMFIFSSVEIENFTAVNGRGCWPRPGRAFYIYGPKATRDDFEIVLNILMLDTSPRVVVYGEPNEICSEILDTIDRWTTRKLPVEMLEIPTVDGIEINMSRI